MSGTVTLFFSGCSGSTEIKKRQLHITTLLEAQNISFKIIDVSDDHDALERMRALAENETAIAPQIANGDEYCGDFNAFESANEQQTLPAFLKLK